MRRLEERGVRPKERDQTLLAGLADWDSARIFLEVVRRGSFRSAAERLALSINAVRRRIDEFEQRIGVTLFTRDVRGAHLTHEGTLVSSAVERMEAASFEVLHTSNLLANAASGGIRVAVTEGLGQLWLAPRLIEFHQAFPNILVDLRRAVRLSDVSRHEADIAVQLMRPASLDTKLVRLGRMHWMFFAGETYIQKYGAPRTAAELTKHRLVMHVSDQIDAEDSLMSFFPDGAERAHLAMKTNVVGAYYWAIANGAGIGVFPSYACALGGKMIPLEVELNRTSDIWLSYHPGSGRIPRVRNMIDWLVGAFDPAKFPWFKDEFVHPRDFEAAYVGKPLTQVFGGLQPRSGRIE